MESEETGERDENGLLRYGKSVSKLGEISIELEGAFVGGKLVRGIKKITRNGEVEAYESGIFSKGELQTPNGPITPVYYFDSEMVLHTIFFPGSLEPKFMRNNRLGFFDGKSFVGIEQHADHFLQGIFDSDGNLVRGRRVDSSGEITKIKDI